MKMMIQDPEEYFRKFNPYVRRDWENVQLNEVWFSDWKQLDVCCKIGGKSIYPWLLWIEEAKSRAIISWLLAPKPDSLAIGQGIGYALSKYGKPRVFYCDNGRDFKSHYIAGQNKKEEKNEQEGFSDPEEIGVLRALDIEIQFAAPYNGREKLLEPTGGIFTDRTRGWRGSRGHNTKARRKDLSQETKSSKYMTIDEFHDKISDIIDIHNKSIHPTTKKTPNSYWEGFVPQTVSQNVIDLFLMDRTFVTIRDSAFTIKGLVYRHEDLCRIAGMRVQVRRDPMNITRAVVYYEGRVFCAAVLEQKSTYRDQITLATVKNNAALRKKTKEFRKFVIANADIIDDPLFVKMPEVDTVSKPRRRDIRPLPSKVITIHQQEKLALDTKKVLQKPVDRDEPPKSAINMLERLAAASMHQASNNDNY